MDNKNNFFKKIIQWTFKNLATANTKDLILYKVVVLFFSLAMILCASFLLRESVLSNRLKETQSWFIGINHQYNKGVGFSLFSSNNTFSVYMVQILPCIIFLIIILFSRNKLSILMCSFVFAGGMSNVIDRAIPDKWETISETTYHSVVDYWDFGFIDFAVFNLPDAFITSSVLIFFVNILVLTYREEIKPKSKKKEGERVEKL